MILDLIKNGSIISIPNFLNNYEELDSKKESYEYEAVYQPGGLEYGNRFQAHPCYETPFFEVYDKAMSNSIKEQIETLVGKKIIDFDSRLRLSISSELEKSHSFINKDFGFVHQDDKQFAGVLSFDQSFTAGTSFFEYSTDKIPDITYGAWPNRLVLYNGFRSHAACHDFTYERRYALLLFFNVDGYFIDEKYKKGT